MSKQQGLTIGIIEDTLIIRIGTKALQHAVTVGRQYGCGEIKVTNQNDFLSGFVNQLKSEKEDGSTLLHHTFDKCVTEMLENGERGVDEVKE